MAEAFSELLAKNDVYLSAVGHRRVPIVALGLREVDYPFNRNPRRVVKSLRAVIPINDQFQFFQNVGEDPKASDPDYVFTPRRNTPRRYYERSPRPTEASAAAGAGGGINRRKSGNQRRHSSGYANGNKHSNNKRNKNVPKVSDEDDMLMGTGIGDGTGKVRTSVGGTPFYMKVSQRVEQFQEEQRRLVEQQRKAEERRKRLGKSFELRDKDGNELVYDDRGFLVTEELYLRRKEKLNAKPPTPPKEKGTQATGRLLQPTSKYVEKMRQLAYLEKKRKSVWLPGALPSSTVAALEEATETYFSANNGSNSTIARRLQESIEPKARKLPAHLTKRWPEYQLLEDGDIMITIERCCDCHEHEEITHHDEDIYIEKAENLRAALSTTARQFAVRCFSDVKPMEKKDPLAMSINRSLAVAAGVASTGGSQRAAVAFNVDYSASRVGAFEVQVAIKLPKLELSCHLLYSKLFHGRWPNIIAMQKLLCKTLEAADMIKFKAGVAVGVSGALTSEASLTPPQSPMPAGVPGSGSKNNGRVKLPNGLKHPSELPKQKPPAVVEKKKMDKAPDFDLRVQIARSQRRRASDNIEDLFAYIGSGKIQPTAVKPLAAAAASAIPAAATTIAVANSNGNGNGNNKGKRGLGVSFSGTDHVLHPVAEEVSTGVPFNGAFMRSDTTGTGTTGTSETQPSIAGQSMTTAVNEKDFEALRRQQQKAQQMQQMMTQQREDYEQGPEEEGEEVHNTWGPSHPQEQEQLPPLDRLGSQSLEDFHVFHGRAMEQRRQDYFIDSTAYDLDSISPLTGFSPGPSPRVVTFAQSVKTQSEQKKSPGKLRRAQSDTSLNSAHDDSSVESVVAAPASKTMGAADVDVSELPPRSPLRKGAPKSFFADVKPDELTKENTQANSGLDPAEQRQQQQQPPELVPAVAVAVAARRSVLRKSYTEKLFRNINIDFGDSNAASEDVNDTTTLPTVTMTDVNPLAGMGFSNDSAAEKDATGVPPAATTGSFSAITSATVTATATTTAGSIDDIAGASNPIDSTNAKFGVGGSVGKRTQGLAAIAITTNSTSEKSNAAEISPRPPPPASTPMQSCEKLLPKKILDGGSNSIINRMEVTTNLTADATADGNSPLSASVTSYSTAAHTSVAPDSNVFNDKAIDSKAVADRLAAEIAAAKAAAAAERARLRNEKLLAAEAAEAAAAVTTVSATAIGAEEEVARVRSASFSGTSSDAMATPVATTDGATDGQQPVGATLLDPDRRESVPKAKKKNSLSNNSHSEAARNKSVAILKAIQAATAAVDEMHDSDSPPPQFVTLTAADIEQKEHKKRPHSASKGAAAASVAATGSSKSHGRGTDGKSNDKNKEQSTEEEDTEYEDDPDHFDAEGITSTSIPSTIAPENVLSSAQGRQQMDAKMDRLKDMLDDDVSLYNISFNTKHSLGAELAAQYMRGDDTSDDD